MYDIPETFDLSPLVGQNLQQICIGQWDFQLHFEGWSISGQGRIDVDLGEGIAMWFNGEWRKTKDLTSLFGAVVKGWGIDSKRSFHIELDNAAVIYFKSESDQYEDFVINPKGWII